MRFLVQQYSKTIDLRNKDKKAKSSSFKAISGIESSPFERISISRLLYTFFTLIFVIIINCYGAETI